MCDFVWSVNMISAFNCQTPYKKLTRIVKGPTNQIFTMRQILEKKAEYKNNNDQ